MATLAYSVTATAPLDMKGESDDTQPNSESNP